jgi:ferric-dicitrate binding protein FerR (iron transport regulator)
MKDPRKAASVLLKAAEWFLRIEDGPLSEAEKSEFLAWLRSEPLHVRKYLSAARVARCLPSAYKKGPIQESLIYTLSRAAPKQLEESKRRTWEYEMLEILKWRRNQSDSPLPVATRRKGNGVSRDP